MPIAYKFYIQLEFLLFYRKIPPLSPILHSYDITPDWSRKSLCVRMLPPLRDASWQQPSLGADHTHLANQSRPVL